MNKATIIMLLVALVGSASGVYAKLKPSAGAVEPVCGLYGRCVGIEGVEAVFVKDLQMGDDVSLDVTTISAVSKQGWQWMVDSLGLIPKMFCNEENAVEISHFSPPCCPEKTMSYSKGQGCDLVVVSMVQRRVYVFHDYKPEIRDEINNLKEKKQ